MTANSAENRFWVYADTANRTATSPTAARRDADDTAGQLDGLHQTRRDRLHRQRLHRGRHLRHRLDRVPHRLDFTSDTYALSSRAAASDAWTQLRRPVPPPTRSRCVRPPTAPPADLLFRAYKNADLWLDDVRYATRASRRPARHHAAQHADRRSGPSTAADQGGSIDMAWSASTDNVGVAGYSSTEEHRRASHGQPPSLLNADRTPTPTTPRCHRSPLLLRGQRCSTPPATRAGSHLKPQPWPSTTSPPPCRQALPPPAAPSKLALPGRQQRTRSRRL